MILPTLSDGFALNQLEALVHGCPVIAATILEAMATAQALPRPLQRLLFGLSDLGDVLQQLTPSRVCR